MTQGQIKATPLGSLDAPTSRARLPRAPSSRSLAKRERIVEVAMRHFADSGYQAARVEDIAAEMGIAKGSVFQHFGSKQGLFLASYKKAVTMLPAYLDCPPQIRTKGFFEIIEYWLGETPHLVREDWIPYRVTLLGNYCDRPRAEARDQPLPAHRGSVRHRSRSSATASSAARSAPTWTSR